MRKRISVASVAFSLALTWISIGVVIITTGKAQPAPPVEIQRWNDLGDIAYAIHPNGQYIAYGMTTSAIRGDDSADGVVRILRVSDGETIAERAFERQFIAGPGVPPLYLKPGYRTLAFSPDGSWLAVEARYQGYIALCYVFPLNPNEEPSLVAPLSLPEVARAASERLNRIVFSPDASVLYWAFTLNEFMSADYMVGAYSLPEGNLIRTYLAGRFHSNNSPSLDISDDPPFILMHHNDWTRIGPNLQGAFFEIISMNGERQAQTFPKTDANFHRATLSPDGTRMVASGHIVDEGPIFQSVHAWSLPLENPRTSRRIFQSRNEVRAYAWHSNSRVLAIADRPLPDEDAIDLHFVDVIAEETLGVFEGIPGMVQTNNGWDAHWLQFSRDGGSIGLHAGARDLVLYEVPQFNLQTMLKVEQIDPANGMIRVRVFANPATKFSIQSSHDLRQWETSGSGTTGEYGEALAHLPLQESNPATFFRVLEGE